jgi:hypothetical protein
MKHDTQLTQEQRYQIDAYRKAGLNQTETAKKLRVDKSTISREIRRNRGLPGSASAKALSGPPGREPWIPDRGFRLATGGDPDPAGVEPGTGSVRTCVQIRRSWYEGGWTNPMS